VLHPHRGAKRLSSATLTASDERRLERGYHDRKGTDGEHWLWRLDRLFGQNKISASHSVRSKK
jgi:hypothetical protein